MENCEPCANQLVFANLSGLHAVRSPPTSLELSSRHDHPSLVLPLLHRNVVQGLALVLWREDKRIMCCSDGLYAVVSLLCCATAADLPHTNHRNMRPERCGRQLRIFAAQLSVLHGPAYIPMGFAQLPLQYPLNSYGFVTVPLKRCSIIYMIILLEII